MDVKEIDGSLLEGGGQVVRMSIAFSCLMEQPIKITKIRAIRANPGLKPQHLAGINLARRMCNAITSGERLNSNELLFQPKTLKMGNYNINVHSHSAASIPLIIQLVLPITIFSNQNSTIIMKGGTDVSYAPSMDYMNMVLFPIYKLFGIDCEARVIKRGFYPRGRGEVLLTVKPIVNYLKPVIINDFGNCPTINGVVFISGPTHQTNKQQIAQDIVKAVKNKLNGSGYHKVTIETKVEDSDDSGGSVVLVADTSKCLIGSSVIYKKKSSIDSIANEACESFLLDLEAKSCVDLNTMDHLIIFMALANGKSQVRCREMSLHTLTAIHIAKEFTNAKFSVHKTEDGVHEIICEGVGMKNI